MQNYTKETWQHVFITIYHTIGGVFLLQINLNYKDCLQDNMRWCSYFGGIYLVECHLICNFAPINYNKVIEYYFCKFPMNGS